MKTLFRLISYICIMGSLALIMQGCARQSSATTTNNSPIDKSVCANNIFLQHFNCSLEQVEQAAENNNPDAEYALGYMYYYGIGTVSDPDTAIIWIKRAASQGQPLAIEALSAIRKAQFPKMGGVKVNRPSKSAPQSSSSTTRHQPTQTKATTSEPHMSSSNNSLLASHYTIQLFASHKLENVERFQRTLNLSKPVYIFETSHLNTSWYVFTMGNFTTKTKAQVATKQLSQSIRRQKPWLRSFGSMKIIHQIHSN